MGKDILIDSTDYETRIALVENNNLIQFHMQRIGDKGLVGNIYLGKVVRVLPGMQAAFVEIGLERNGFLYVDEIYVSDAEMERKMSAADQLCENKYAFPDSSSDFNLTERPKIKIEDLIKEGQDIIVQVSKDPIGTKGARLTCHITLPCRNLVYMPLTDHIGISRKITAEETRESMHSLIDSLRPRGQGFIARTVAEFAKPGELEADMEFLMLLWDEINDNSTNTEVPSLLYEDLDITYRAIRDLFTPDIDKLIINNHDKYVKLKKFAGIFVPQFQQRIEFYDKDVSLFDSRSIELDIIKALDKKVWLRSGGYIIVETTEALSVIDVNTGRYVGNKDLEDTIFKTNIEAAKEIAYQIQLRNIGGIIIIDFIDMAEEDHREELINFFKDAVQDDKSKINILNISEFGLVQMTRKRNCENLNQILCEPCFYCSGNGFLKSHRTICNEIIRKVVRKYHKVTNDIITIKAHPTIAEMLMKEEPGTSYLEKETYNSVSIMPDYDLHIEQYEIH